MTDVPSSRATLVLCFSSTCLYQQPLCSSFLSPSRILLAVQFEFVPKRKTARSRPAVSESVNVVVNGKIQKTPGTDLTTTAGRRQRGGERGRECVSHGVRAFERPRRVWGRERLTSWTPRSSRRHSISRSGRSENRRWTTASARVVNRWLRPSGGSASSRREPRRAKRPKRIWYAPRYARVSSHPRARAPATSRVPTSFVARFAIPDTATTHRTSQPSIFPCP